MRRRSGFGRLTPCADLRKCKLQFDASLYGETIANILAFDGGGKRALPLVCNGCSSKEAHAALSRTTARELFDGARAPEAALSGLWLYFSCFDECHRVSQDVASAEGSYWHAMVHRQEPDAGNSAYWFRRVGRHAVFPALLDAAREIASQRPQAKLQLGSAWHPFRFIDYCEEARQKPGSAEFEAAREVQLAEWQLLFDYCARPQS